MDDINLKGVIVRSSFIAAILQLLDKVLTIIGLIILARLLKPYDFGLAFLAQTFISFFSMFKFNIFNTALIYEREDSDKIYEVGFSSDLLFSVMLFSMLFCLAPLWAHFYNVDILKDVVRLYGIVILMESLGSVSRTKLIKKLKFAKVGAINLSITLVRITSTITLAIMGFAFWSIIFGSMAATIFAVISFNLSERFQMHLHIDPKVLKKLIGYAKYMFFINIGSFILSEISGIAIGKIIGVVAAGFFMVANKWGFWAFNNIFAFIEGLLFPIYSNYQQDEETARRIFIKTLRYGSIIAFPMSFGLFLVAPEFTNIILGHKWAPIIIPLKILSLAGLVQFLGYLSTPFLKGIGHVKQESKRICLNILFLFIFLFPLARLYGITGASTAILLASIITQPIFYIYSIKILKVDVLEVIKTISTPLVATSFMVVSIFLLRQFLFNFYIENVEKFLILIISGALIYSVAIILFMKREIISEITSFRLSRYI